MQVHSTIRGPINSNSKVTPKVQSNDERTCQIFTNNKVMGKPLLPMEIVASHTPKWAHAFTWSILNTDVGCLWNCDMGTRFLIPLVTKCSLHEWLAPLSSKPVFYCFPIPMGTRKPLLHLKIIQQLVSGMILLFKLNLWNVYRNILWRLSQCQGKVQ